MTLSANQVAQLDVMKDIIPDATLVAGDASDAVAIAAIAQYSPIMLTQLNQELADLTGQIAGLTGRQAGVQSTITLLQTAG